MFLMDATHGKTNIGSLIASIPRKHILRLGTVLGKIAYVLDIPHRRPMLRPAFRKSTDTERFIADARSGSNEIQKRRRDAGRAVGHGATRRTAAIAWR